MHSRKWRDGILKLASYGCRLMDVKSGGHASRMETQASSRCCRLEADFLFYFILKAFKVIG